MAVKPPALRAKLLQRVKQGRVPSEMAMRSVPPGAAVVQAQALPLARQKETPLSRAASPGLFQPPRQKGSWEKPLPFQAPRRAG